MIEDDALGMFIEISHIAFETDKRKVLEALSRVHQYSMRIQDRKRAIRLFQMCLLYVMEIKENIEASEVEQAVQETADERGGTVPTIAEKLRNEGKEIGKELGKEIGKEELLWMQIQEKFSKAADEYHDRLKGLSSKELDQIGIALFKMEKASDLEKYL